MNKFPELMSLATQWLKARRDEIRPVARVLSDHEQSVLSGYFDPLLLDSVRVLLDDDLSTVSDTVFQQQFGEGERPIDLRQIKGLTLIDTIVLAQNRIATGEEMMATLFQELVHVHQFRVLGVSGFLDHYLRGWLAADRRHSDIPLERDAEDLRDRFMHNQNDSFLVAEKLPYAC